MNKIIIYRKSEILSKLDYSIKNKKPFSLIRIGDGGIKLLHAYLSNDYDQLEKISNQEGIPINSYDKIIEFWKKSANISDFIDTPEVYFDDKFWNRTRGLTMKKMSDKTMTRLKMWKDIYNDIGIINENYCNPEINFLLCTGVKSLPDLIMNKKICCITSRDDVNKQLKDYNIDVFKIVGKYENQYEKSFSDVINLIDEHSNDYDLWLIAAGELGRIYSGLIKYKGGRALDIGSLIDFWCTKEIPSRLKPYLDLTIHNLLKLKFTERGKTYLKFI